MPGVESINDKNIPDSTEVTLGDAKFTLGQLREYQKASGQDIAKLNEDLNKERVRAQAAEDAAIKVWQQLEALRGAPPTPNPAPPQSVLDDPLFSPVTKYYDPKLASYDQRMTGYEKQVKDFQNALAQGVRYIVDTFSEMRYQSLPEDFRKDTPYEKAVQLATEQKYLDRGGVPDIRKVYDAWEAPRAEKRARDKMRAEVEAEFSKKQRESLLPRPGNLPGMPPPQDANAPRNIRQAFAQAKSDPEVLEALYGMKQ